MELMTVGPFQHQFGHNQSLGSAHQKTIESETSTRWFGAVTPGPNHPLSFRLKFGKTLAAEGRATDSAKRPQDGEALSNRFVMVGLRSAKGNWLFYRALPKSTQAPNIDSLSCDAGFEPSINGQNRGKPEFWIVLADQLPVKIMPIESLPTDASGRPDAKSTGR